jgi:short-subunit dehydrogenase
VPHSGQRISDQDKHMAGTFLSIGAGPGIGISTARRFAAEGYKIVLAARDVTRLAAMAADLRDGPNCGVDVDAIDCADSSRVAALVDRHASDLQVLHYNAAVLRGGSLQAQSVESIATDLEIDVTSALVATRQAYAAMSGRGSGSILLTGGALAKNPIAEMLTLSVGKAALRCAAQALFPQFAQQGIHIGVLTIAAHIAPNSSAAIAVGEAFWSLHAQPRDQWHWEASYP